MGKRKEKERLDVDKTIFILAVIGIAFLIIAMISPVAFAIGFLTFLFILLYDLYKT